jgi:hypothetical protein
VKNWDYTSEIKYGDRLSGTCFLFTKYYISTIVHMTTVRLLSVTPTKFNIKYESVYSYAPHNDVSVNDQQHIRRWSHNIIILYYNT